MRINNVLSTVKLGFNLKLIKLIATKAISTVSYTENVLYNILKVLRNPLGGKHRKRVIKHKIFINNIINR